MQEHEVCAQRLLGRVWVLDVTLPRLASLALSSSEKILAFDVVRSQGSHIGIELTLTSFFEDLRTFLIRFLLGLGERSVFLTCFFGSLRDVQLPITIGLVIGDPIGKV